MVIRVQLIMYGVRIKLTLATVWLDRSFFISSSFFSANITSFLWIISSRCCNSWTWKIVKLDQQWRLKSNYTMFHDHWNPSLTSGFRWSWNTVCIYSSVSWLPEPWMYFGLLVIMKHRVYLLQCFMITRTLDVLRASGDHETPCVFTAMRYDLRSFPVIW